MHGNPIFRLACLLLIATLLPVTHLFAQPIPGGCGVVGPNLVANPEFDLGNVDFSCDYQFNQGFICEFGQYTVTNRILFDPNIVCYSVPGFSLLSIWAVSDRNEPGSGNFQVIDPSEATGAADDVWRQQVPVCPNTDYTFSVYAKNIYFLEAPNYSGVDPEFELEINGVPVFGYYVDGVLQTNSSFDLVRQPQADSMVWIQISGTWNSGTTTTADIVVRNLITGSQGNDLAIDGVFFGICGEDVALDVQGSLEQCSGDPVSYTEVTLNPSAATLASGWLYHEWYRNGVLVSSDNTPPVSLTPDTTAGNHFGEYALMVYRDPLGPLGGGCGFESDVIAINDTCTTTFPVEWLAFDAEKEGSQVVLNWQTASELNNKGFEVEIAKEGDAYHKLAFVNGTGTSNSVQSYKYQTGDLVAGNYRFRIKQIDLDGEFSYSPSIQVSVILEDHYQAVISPNPSAYFAQLEFEVNTSQPMQIDLYRVDGSLVRNISQSVFEAGQRHPLEIDVRSLASGMYFVQLRGATFVGVERLVVQH